MKYDSIIKTGESSTVEFKSTFNQEVVEAVGAFANKRGGIIVNESEMTTREGVFAGGDAVTGAATVILAMGAGKSAAKGIDEYLSGN